MQIVKNQMMVLYVMNVQQIMNHKLFLKMVLLYFMNKHIEIVHIFQ